MRKIPKGELQHWGRCQGRRHLVTIDSPQICWKAEIQPFWRRPVYSIRECPRARWSARTNLLNAGRSARLICRSVYFRFSRPRRHYNAPGMRSASLAGPMARDRSVVDKCQGRFHVAVPSPIAGRIVRAKRRRPAVCLTQPVIRRPLFVADVSTMWMLANSIETDASTRL